MKSSLCSFVLATLGLSALSSAQLKTIVALDKKEYLAPRPTPPPTPSGSDIEIRDDDGVDIYLGPDISQKVIDAYKSKCKPEDFSQECMDAINESLGIGPTPVDGLQKRITKAQIKPSIAGAAALYVGYLSYLWKWLLDDDDPKNFKTLTMHIPPIQTSSLDGFKGSDAYAWATKSGDPGYTISLAPIATPAPEKTPDTEEKDGGAIMHLPELKDALVDSTKGTICGRKTLTSSQCVVQGSCSIVKEAQRAGGLAALLFMKHWVFPEPKLPLLVTSLKETTDCANEVDFGPGVDVKTKTQLATAATWISWGYLDQHLELDNQMTFTKTMLKTATQTQADDGECKDGPDEEDTPFCDNCGGNREGDKQGPAGELRGKCVGFEGGDYFRGCPCFVKDVKEGATGIDLNKAYQAILDFPDYEPEEPKEPESYNKICFKEQTDVRNDASKWRWTQRDLLAEKIEEFCSLEFNTAHESAQREYAVDGHDGFRLTVRYKGIKPPDRNTCIYNLRDQITDGCDADARLNQHNLKWGGRSTYKPSGLEFEVYPLLDRVAKNNPNWECSTFANRGQKNFKGKSGKDLANDIDDAMMKQMCVHQLWNLGWRTDSNKLDCGGDYNIVLTGSNGYKSHNDCWNYNYPCISDSIQKQAGVIMTGTHWAGSSGHTKNYLGVRCWIGFDKY